ncbi:MAG: GFA family protein [Pseudomonadota bacterium]
MARKPDMVAYCHCGDCRRWTGAPVAAFAAFSPSVLTGLDMNTGRSHAPGVTRWTCAVCGSPLAAHFDYLQDQIYVPLGIIDQAASLPPVLHSHAGSALPWLHIQDDAPRASGTARDSLGAAGT